ncbi:epiphycan [Conger conger]|uniref:epiphycan n=1 Tax=Conger conger TaxID=82655 RepID=UPI002A5A5BB0|nr:epiphycan [Conger conger]
MGEMMKTVVRFLLCLLILRVAVAVPSRLRRQVELDTYDSANYDVDLDSLNLENHDIYDYDDELTIDEPQIEIGTLAPMVDGYHDPAASLEEEEEEEEHEEEEHEEEEDYHEEVEEEEVPVYEEEEIPLRPQPPISGVLMGPDTQGGLPTCLLCTCMGGSVYCDDTKLESIPPLPKDTTHFYARFNQISKINKGDFAHMNKLKRIDLTSNEISQIDRDALVKLPVLEELLVRENSLAQLPPLPASMTLIDASHNRLGSRSIQREAFKDMTNLLYLYLTDNSIDHIPLPLPHSLRSLHLQNNNIQMIHDDTFCHSKDPSYIRNGLEDIRLDGNPVNLSKTPQAYICLPRMPIGNLI